MKTLTTTSKYLSQNDLNYLLGLSSNDNNICDISICLFASFGKNDFDDNTLEYIKELANYFTYIIVITNIERENTQKCASFPINASICFTNNESYDFGMYYRVIISLSESQLYSEQKISKIGLINDSCLIISSFHKIFEMFNEKEIWGITKSFEGHEHLQSYFLIFQSKKSIHFLFEYFRKHDVFELKRKNEIISTYEIGLSKYFIQHDFQLDALFTSEGLTKNKSNRRKNPSYVFWKEMIENGSPVLKKNKK